MNYKERLKMEEQEEKTLLSPERAFYVPDSNNEEAAPVQPTEVVAEPNKK